MDENILALIKEALLRGFSCVREMESADAEAEDFVFLCQIGITPDLTLESADNRLP